MTLISRSVRLFIVAIAASLLLMPLAEALEYPDKPESSDFYVDEAYLLEAADAEQINNTALALLQEEQVAIFVVTIESLADYDAFGYSIEGYAADLFDEWGIGTQERNYGMLLLVSKGDRKARIELGADWGREYDRQAKEVMDTLIIPQFKKGAFSKGILDGVRGMDSMARGLALPKPETPWWFFPLVIAGAIGIVALVINLFKTGKSGWAWMVIIAVGSAILFMLWAAAQNRGSGGGFGGGSSGGGGATGSW